MGGGGFEGAKLTKLPNFRTFLNWYFICYKIFALVTKLLHLIFQSRALFHYSKNINILNPIYNKLCLFSSFGSFYHNFQTYMPQDLQPGEELTPDMSAYEMLHTVNIPGGPEKIDSLV